MNLRYQTPEQAVALVKSGDRVFIHGSAATPVTLVNALLNRAGQIRDVELVSISTHGDLQWDTPHSVARLQPSDDYYLRHLAEC